MVNNITIERHLDRAFHGLVGFGVGKVRVRYQATS